MKTKNVIGHMTVQKDSVKGWFRRWGILPRFICLLLAVLLWLIIVNTNTGKIEWTLFSNGASSGQEEIAE